MNLLVNGILLGLGYCLISIGMALIVGVAKVLDLAYCIYYTIAVYVVFILLKTLPPVIPIWGLFMVGIGSAAVIALLVHYFLVLPTRKEPHAVLISTVAICMVVQELLIFKEGSEPVYFPMILKGATNLFGVWTTNQMILVAIITIATITSLWVLLNKTRLGLAIRATADQPEAVQLAGGNIKHIRLIAGALAGIVAGIGAVFLSPIYPPHPLMWLDTVIIAFAVIVLGGLGSIWGCIPAALILGISEVAIAIYLPYGGIVKRAVGLVIIFLVLLFRPTGLLGVKGWEEAQ